MIQKTTLFALGALLAVLLFPSCNNKQGIQVYRVSKEAAPPENTGMPAMDGNSSMPSMTGAAAPGGESAIISTPPAGWEPQPPSSMRLASFLVKGDNGAVADISLIALGGGAGGVLENVNRWYSQLGQPAITQENLAQTAKHVPSMFGDVMLVDIEGKPAEGAAEKDGRIIGGIVPGEGRTMFFKMRGNTVLAEAQKQNFIKWIGSVRPEEPAGGGVPGMPTASAGMTGAAVPAPEETGASPKIKWEAPDSWKPVPATQMRYATFAITGQNGETADLSISVFPGEAGGDLQNVNRWRDQIGLEPVADIKTLAVPLTGKTGEILTLDMLGSKGRMLVGWTRKNGNTWFFKMTGPDQLTAGEKERFVKFLQSVEYPQ